jgi:hypothetical protein
MRLVSAFGRGRFVGVAATVALVGALLVIPGSGSAQTGTGQTTAGNLIAITPVRVLDTRPGPGIQAGQTLTVSFPVTFDSTAVLVNVTADSDATAPTFITVWPADQPKPSTSVINPAPGRVTSGSILVPIDANRQASFYNNTGSVSLIVDLEGYLVPAGALKPEFGYDSRTGPTDLPVPQLGGGLPGAELAAVPVPALFDHYLVSADVAVTAGPADAVVTCGVSQLPIGQVANDINFVALTASVVVPANQTANLHIGGAVTAAGLHASPTTTYAMYCNTSGPTARAGRATLSVMSVGERLTATG